jgi:dTDP-4-amino-4,6-dideoxygalactose transaminase
MLEVDESKRDALVAHLRESGVEAKVHYPIPLFLQKGLRHLGYKPGDFPVTERQARRVVSLPVDQHLTEAQIDHAIASVRGFFEGG